MVTRLAFACIGLAITLLAVLFFTEPAEGHHDPDGLLAYVPNTPFIQAAKARQELGYCFNPRASAYPNFRQQIRDMHLAYTDGVGNTFREIGPTFTDPLVARSAGCIVFHEMPDNHGCGSRCAAWVFYTNNPCHIQYKWQLGYFHWGTTSAHEKGHCYGENEGYVDAGTIESHINSRGYWASPWNGPTVMDVGTFIPFPPYGLLGPTAQDVALICVSVIRESWCGQAPEPPSCEGHFSEAHPWMRFDPCSGRWVNVHNGWSVNPGDDSWFDPNGVATWTGCNQDRLRWNHKNQQWDGNGTLYFKPGEGFWSGMPPC